MLEQLFRRKTADVELDLRGFITRRQFTCRHAQNRYYSGQCAARSISI